MATQIVKTYPVDVITNHRTSDLMVRSQKTGNILTVNIRGVAAWAQKDDELIGRVIDLLTEPYTSPDGSYGFAGNGSMTRDDMLAFKELAERMTTEGALEGVMSTDEEAPLFDPEGYDNEIPGESDDAAFDAMIAAADREDAERAAEAKMRRDDAAQAAFAPRQIVSYTSAQGRTALYVVVGTRTKRRGGAGLVQLVKLKPQAWVAEAFWVPQARTANVEAYRPE